MCGPFFRSTARPPTGGRRRPVAVRTAVVAALAAATIAGLAAPASAHTVLIATMPTAGYTVAGPVEQVSLTFTEAVTATQDAVRISGPTAHLRGLAESQNGGLTLVVPTGRLEDGVYTVSWRVTADDGDVVEGRYRFGVGPNADATSPRSTSPRDGSSTSVLLTAVLRWVLFVGLVAGLGGLAGAALVGRLRRSARHLGVRELPDSWEMPGRSLCLVSALAALALAAHASNRAFFAGLGSLRPWAIVGGGATAVPVGEALLFTFAALLLCVPRRWRAAAVAPLLGVAVAEGLRGHLYQQIGPSGAVVISVHVALAAAWFGALLVVVRTAAIWRAAGRTGAGWQLVHDYSTVALFGYVAVVSTGTVAAVLLVPSWSALLETGYGWSLVVKLVLVALVSIIAFRSRRLLQRVEGADQTLPLSRIEPGALTAVLAAAAVLVSLVPPRLLARAVEPPPPPAPSGPVVQLGDLVGQLTVGLTVAVGQVSVQVSSPASDDSPAREEFAVEASASQPNTIRPSALTLQPCGAGCFVAPVHVRAGGLTLHLTVGSNDWQGGRVDFDVPWPPVSATALLHRALALLSTERSVTLQESVSSDTSRSAPDAISLHDTGHEFLDTEPYGQASKLRPVLLAPMDGSRRLAFGVGDSIFVQFSLDGTGRIFAERLVTPNHLIVRRFGYR